MRFLSSIKKTICERRSYSNYKNQHVHDYYQLLIPLQGDLHIGTTNKQIILNEQRLLFLPPNCEHSYFAVDRNEFIVLDIPNFLLSKISHAQRLSEGKVFENNDCWHAIRSLLLYELDKKENNHSVQDLMHYISRLLSENDIPQSIQYIHENYNKPVSIETLAALEHYHVAYFGQWFKEKYHTSPKKYIQAIRIEKAKQLLLDTDLPLLAIANLVGYEFQSSLTRVFQQFEQITPLHFRKIHKK